MIAFLTHLGLAYNAFRVAQDSGLWTLDQESLRTYLEAWGEDRRAQKSR